MTAHDDAMRRQAVAELVRHQRGLKGLSVVKAAKLAEVGRSTWTEIESGQSPIPKADTLGKVARAIMLDANVLLDAAGYTAPEPSKVFISYTKDDTQAAADFMLLIAGIAERLGRIEERLDSQDADRGQLRDELQALRDEVQRAPRPTSSGAPR